jgi:hypothetical protein
MRYLNKETHTFLRYVFLNGGMGDIYPKNGGSKINGILLIVPKPKSAWVKI